MLAKCIVDQQLCSFHFTSAVYKKLLLQPFTVEDLEVLIYPKSNDSTLSQATLVPRSCIP